MKTFVKNYIGKGKQVAGLSIAKVTCKLEDLQKFAYFFDGIEYVTFEVAKMKQADSFGRDYTVYVSQAEEEKTEKPTKSPAPKAPRKQKEILEPVTGDDLPFYGEKNLAEQGLFMIAILLTSEKRPGESVAQTRQ